MWVYTEAKSEDRRNAQWFGSGAIVAPGFSGSTEQELATAYVTPSRYARKLRRHLEAKVRAFAVRFLTLRSDYPATLESAVRSGVDTAGRVLRLFASQGG